MNICVDGLEGQLLLACFGEGQSNGEVVFKVGSLYCGDNGESAGRGLMV